MLRSAPEKLLVIACGALAREIVALKKRYGWDYLDLLCLPASLHNRPAWIAPRLRQKIADNQQRYDRIFVAYADCGTAGAIDEVLKDFGVERLGGVHCYQFFAGNQAFQTMTNEEPGTFYLTDFLAQHFDRFVMRPLKLLTHPELRDAYFGNYRRLVYLSQCSSEHLLAEAKAAASTLGLEFFHHHSGYGGLEAGISDFVNGFAQDDNEADTRLLA